MTDPNTGTLDVAAAARQGELSRSSVGRWTVKRFIELVPGSTRRNWSSWIPALIAAGVIRKVGKGWLGRRDEIERALMRPEVQR